MTYKQKRLILFFLMVYLWIQLPVYGQISYGGQIGYVRTTFFKGSSIDIIFRSTKEKHYIQCGVGTILNKNIPPKLSLGIQLGNYIQKNTKKICWINELYLTYGKYDGHGIAPIAGGSAFGNCNTGKMTITLNSGIDYKILTLKNISISTFGKVGLGSALLVESYLPDCKGSNGMMRLNFGISMFLNK